MQTLAIVGASLAGISAARAARAQGLPEGSSSSATSRTGPMTGRPCPRISSREKSVRNTFAWRLQKKVKAEIRSRPNGCWDQRHAAWMPRPGR